MKKGFTLVELLIVISLIAILTTVAIMSFRNQINKGNDAKRKSDINTIKVAVEEYEKDRNCYPSESGMAKCGTDSTIAVLPYLSNVPCDPVTGKPYAYEAPSGCAGWYRLYGDLQNSSDVQIIPNIGPDGSTAYNFYEGSSNAPVPVGSQSTPTSTPGGAITGYWGCVNKVCVPIEVSSPGQPVCSPTYGTPDCINANCSTGANPCQGQ